MSCSPPSSRSRPLSLANCPFSPARSSGALQPAQVVTAGSGEELGELLSRLGPEVQVAQGWSVATQHLRPGADIWAETAGVGGLGMPGRPAAAAVWAEPQRGQGEGALQTLARYLAPGARLCVGTTGWLRRALPEWKEGERERPARRPAGLRRTVRRLRQGGFLVEAVYGFPGPVSLGWGFASRFPAALGRADLVDRCLAAMRRSYVVTGWQASWTPVAVVLARKRSD